MKNFGLLSQLAHNPPLPLLCLIPFLGNGKKNTEEIFTLVTLFLHRFYLENYFLDKYVRYNLTVYPVVIAALTGSACRNRSFSSPMTNDVFIGESF